MGRTNNALEIMNRLFGHDADTLARLEEERLKSLAAMAVYDLRTAACLTQGQLAERVGIEEAVITQLEDADYDGHNLTMLYRIASAFNQRVELRFVPLETSAVPVSEAQKEQARMELLTQVRDLEERVDRLAAKIHHLETAPKTETVAQ